jgi:extracellular elastinolytic metalloproteinase
VRSSGFLTRPSSAGPAAAGLAYIRRRPGRFRLDVEDLGGQRLVRSRRWASGLRQAEFVQTAHGIRALGPALRATADRAGRLVSLSTSAIPDLSSVAPPAPHISAGEALRRALAEVGVSRRLGRSTREAGAKRNRRFAAGHRAHLVWLPVGERVRLGWRLLAFADSQHVYDAVVDARDGRTLVRRNLVKTAGSGLAWDNHPGAPAGGTQAARDLTPWLSAGDRLAGPNALVYSDVQDEIYTSLQNGQPFPQPGTADQIAPDGAGNWNFPQTLFPLDADERSCPPPEPLGSCSWDSFEGATGLTNRRQNGAQVFYFVNRFHDHLASAAGIGFTPAVGAFDGDDPLHAQVLDGASTGGAGPDGDHLNNANMLTLPDGISPVMQMFLFTNPDLVGPGVNVGINDVKGGDDAAVVLHEYTHGLSNRLVCCDSDGFGVLGGPQGGAIDEASADWYAEDFLNAQGLQPDTAAPGEIAIGTYENLSVRTQPMDCPPGGGGPACPGDGSAGPGGYTYGDFARIVELDEVDRGPVRPRRDSGWRGARRR